jgi:hypothetical protein
VLMVSRKVKYSSTNILIYKYNRMQKLKEFFMFAFVKSSNLCISLLTGNDNIQLNGRARPALRYAKARYKYSFRSVNQTQSRMLQLKKKKN